MIIIPQVVEPHVSGDFVLVEVLYVQAIINGSAVTAVRLDELKKEHRRHKRDVETETISFRESHTTGDKFSVSFGFTRGGSNPSFKPISFKMHKPDTHKTAVIADV